MSLSVFEADKVLVRLMIDEGDYTQLFQPLVLETFFCSGNDLSTSKQLFGFLVCNLTETKYGKG